MTVPPDAPPTRSPLADATALRTGPPGWYPDPARRHELRWWHERWSEHVADRGHRGIDPLPPLLPLPAFAVIAAPELVVEYAGPYARNGVWGLSAGGRLVGRAYVPPGGPADLVDPTGVLVMRAEMDVGGTTRVLDLFDRLLGDVAPSSLDGPLALRAGPEVVGWAEIREDPAGRAATVRDRSGTDVAWLTPGTAPGAAGASAMRNWWALQFCAEPEPALRVLTLGLILGFGLLAGA